MSTELEKSEISRTVTERIERHLAQEKTFRSEKVQRWCEAICRDSTRELAKLKKPYKLVVACIINQRCGNGLFQHISSFSDARRDVVSVVHWKNDLLHCIVTVLALPLF